MMLDPHTDSLMDYQPPISASLPSMIEGHLWGELANGTWQLVVSFNQQTWWIHSTLSTYKKGDNDTAAAAADDDDDDDDGDDDDDDWYPLM